MPDSETSVFADVSVLIDYCTPFTPQHQYACKVLNKVREEGGEVTISNRAGKALTGRIANQQQLFDHLFREASRCIKEYSQPTSVFKGDVLNREELDSKLPVGISTEYNLRALRVTLDEIGLGEFREKVHDFQRVNHRQQRRLESAIICDRFEIGGADTTYVKLPIESKSTDDAQVESMVDGLYWCRENGNKMLVRHTHDLYQEKDELSDSLPHRYEYDVISPQDAIES
jgi:hypothetical protein